MAHQQKSVAKLCQSYTNGANNMAEKFISKAIKKPGALRKALHIKEGEKIPEKKLKAAEKKPGKMGQRARLAETLKEMKKK